MDNAHPKPDPKEEELLQHMLRENPMFKETAEAIARDHGMTLLEAAGDLRESW